MIENRENSGRHAGDRATKKDTLRGSARPTLLKGVRETDSRRRSRSWWVTDSTSLGG